jgi:N-acetylglucosaminyldiphosphoundecaprenol N-acetyl-beta-D-mannosaminyltransferase
MWSAQTGAGFAKAPLMERRERRSPRAPALQTKRLPLAILGIPFDCVTIPEALDAIEDMIQSGRPHQLVTANVDFLVQSLTDLELRRVLAEADLVLCDGTPLVWASRCLGNALPERVAGADLVPLLIRRAAERGYRIFFLGGKSEVAAKAVERLQREHPNLQIAGHYSPPFASLLEMDHPEIRRRIRRAQPDILLVSFGCPKAEKWIAMNCRSLGVPVCIGVGATIDFLAGEMKRAPEWMQYCGMEWVFRFLQEPARLGPRYATDLRRFSLAFARQWLAAPHSPRFQNGNGNDSLKFSQSLDCMRITAPAHLDLKVLAEDLPIFPLLTQDCLIDLSGVKSIDGSAIGWLVRLQRNLHAAGRSLVLVAPAKEVQRALHSVSLDDLFVVAHDRAEAERWLKNCSRAHLATLAENDDHSCSLFTTEITRKNAAHVLRRVLVNLRFHEPGDAIVLKMDHVRATDSAGASALARASRAAQRHGLSLRLMGVQSGVRNVLAHAGLEDLIAPEPR